MKLYKRLSYLILSIILFLSFILALSVNLFVVVKADTRTDENTDTVYINTIDDFKYLSDLKYSGKMFLLTSDMDFLGAKREPIDTYRMSGTFDGCGHTIKNFTVDSADKYTGFFSRTKLDIKNLFISEAYVSNGENSGILAGLNLGEISNVHISGDIAAESNAGGLIAENFGIIDNCSFDGTVYGRKAGGLIGLNESAQIHNSYSNGKVSGQIIGGLISSAMQSNESFTEIRDCFSFCELIQIEITESVKRAGGLIGIRDSDITIKNCFSDNNFPAIALGDFEGVKELNKAKRNDKSTFKEFDFENYWFWDETANTIRQRTIAVSSNLIKVDGQQVFVIGNRNYYLPNEAVTLRLNTSKSNPNIGLTKLKVLNEDVSVKLENFELNFDLYSNIDNILVEFDYSYLLKVEINIYDSTYVSLEKQTQYFAPEEEIVFIVKKLRGYKNFALYAIFKEEQVEFTDISTEEDKSNKIKRFKAEINESCYSASDMLYVSANYEEVNNLWWIVFMSVILSFAAVIIVVFLVTTKKSKNTI